MPSISSLRIRFALGAFTLTHENDDLIDSLLERHNDTWPITIGHGELINRDGLEAAGEIKKLRQRIAELEKQDEADKRRS